MARYVIRDILRRKIMDAGGYKIRNQKEIHFYNFCCGCWIDVFIRQASYLIDSDFANRGCTVGV
jgi:hypothetical protein